MTNSTARSRAVRSLLRPGAVVLLTSSLILGSGAAAQAGLVDDLLDGGPCLPSLVDDCDETPPETSIDSIAPMPLDGYITSRSIAFAFSGQDDRDDAALTFECRLITPDEPSPAWSPCLPEQGAEYDVEDSEADAYRFEVRATDDAVTFPGDAAPHTDPTPASASFGVDTVAPQTRRFSRPPSYSLSRSAEFVHGASEAGTTYRCVLDGAELGCSQDYLKVTRLRSGRHRLSVAAVDSHGNADASPVVTTWWVPRNTVGTRKERQRWRRAATDDSFDRDLLSTRRKGAVLSMKVQRVRKVGLAVQKAPGYGRLRVMLDRTRLGVIDLDGARTASEVVTLRVPGRKRRSGVVKVIPTSRSKVVVDAFFSS